MKEKPSHLSAQYGRQFQDQSISDAYYARPPYPQQVYDILISLIPDDQLPVLELGSGTADLTLEVARWVSHIDAVEPSEAMLQKSIEKVGDRVQNLTWHHMTAEKFEPQKSFGLVFAGQSLHWMDWPIVLPMIRRALVDDGVLAIVERRVLPRPWDRAIWQLIPQFSTNKEFTPYDLVHELASRGLFQESGRQETDPVHFEQGLEDYVESFHSRNGFSRERMSAQQAAEFDAAVRAAAQPFSVDGRIAGQVKGSVIWGRPLSP